MAHKTRRTKDGLTVWIRAGRLDAGGYTLDGSPVKRTALPSAIADLLDSNATASVGVGSAASATKPRKRTTTKKSS